MRVSQIEKARVFRRLHLEPPILVLPNAWDVASAKKLAEIPGCRALATSSGAVARSLGFEDGEHAPAAVMIDANARIADAVELPVTADLEAGYGDPVGTAQAAWQGGLVGLNFEDSRRGVLEDVDEQAARIRAIRSAVPELVLNARVDTFLHGDGDVDKAVERANAYLVAGADCAYPIFCPTSSIAELAGRIDGPINVLITPGTPSVAELAAFGAARATWGAGLAGLAYAEAVRVAADALSGG
jgi:2-methylisocitrate lyase-like PEP mutase family enzyme